MEETPTPRQMPVFAEGFVCLLDPPVSGRRQNIEHDLSLIPTAIPLLEVVWPLRASEVA